MKIDVRREDETTVYGVVVGTGQWVMKDRQASDGWMVIDEPAWAKRERVTRTDVTVTHVETIRVTRTVTESKVILASELGRYAEDGWEAVVDEHTDRVPLGKLPRN